MELTMVFIFALLIYGAWNFKRNVSKAKEAADKLSPETKAKAKEIGLGLLSKLWK